MKIRIEGSSVRLRLRRSEVDRLSAGETISGTTTFPEGGFRYCLELSKSSPDLEAHLEPDGISLFLPESWGREWAGSDRVGFETSQPLSGGNSLKLMVEKDFVCLDRDPAGQEDQYPNPKSETCEN